MKLPAPIALFAALLFFPISTEALGQANEKKTVWQQDGVKHYDLCEEAFLTRREARAAGAGLYNWLAHTGASRRAIDDGFIISLEKFPKTDPGLVDDAHKTHLRTFSEIDPTDVSRTRDRWLKKAFNDPKLQIVTHIHEFTNRRKTPLYNPYPHVPKNWRDRPKNLGFEKGIGALKGVFKKRLQARIRSGRYSHIVFMAMGWHNDQRVSICRYNVIMNKTRAAYAKFRPLVVGLTWPSSWFSGSKIKLIDNLGQLASIFNKSTDSDETGYLHGNLIINRIVPEANHRNLPVIALGHSMGTRVVARSIFSRSILRGKKVGNGPDLAVILQPAHSVYRYAKVNDRGREGHPFAAANDIKTKVYVTSSKFDTANPLAIWTKYLGGRSGFKIAASNKDDFEVLGTGQTVTGIAGHIRNHTYSRVTIVDADRFVFNHNDIMSEEMGQLIAALIKRHAPAR